MGTGVAVDEAFTITTVHPHGRGDWLFVDSRFYDLLGSPPRAWGLVSLAPSACLPRRFTPTGVGTGKGHDVQTWGNTVHPHGRGDWEIIREVDHDNLGSPPRAWGLEAGPEEQLKRTRFTPTGVGTGIGARVFFPEKAVHPHGRGDW